MTSVVNLMGIRFGKLVVIARDENRLGASAYWICQCDCGSKTSVRGYVLTAGKSKTCGCWKIKHGDTIGHKKSAEYTCWHNMLTRCRSSTVAGYAYYGGRGITVCKRWHRFENFLADMGRRPSPDLSIERVNNNKGYFPKNCIWATDEIQLKNRRPYKPRVKMLVKKLRDMGATG